ncbi:hypothetical protein [Streptomyces jumonjinensis]|uniref:hypothetical protein n=1 Tax=Streptomyces jumonjinensis TaxID=1945 RepID=UPI0037A8688A
MTASAQLPLSAPTAPTAPSALPAEARDRALGDERLPGPRSCSAAAGPGPGCPAGITGPAGLAPLISEPPLSDAAPLTSEPSAVGTVPLTSEPPLAGTTPLTSEPSAAGTTPLTSEPSAAGLAGGARSPGV